MGYPVTCPACSTTWDCRSNEEANSPRRDDQLCPSCYTAEHSGKPFFTVGGCGVHGTFFSLGDAVAAWITAGCPVIRGNSVWINEHKGAETIGPDLILDPPQIDTMPAYVDGEARPLVRFHLRAGSSTVFASGREAVRLAKAFGVGVTVTGSGPRMVLAPDVAQAAIDSGAPASRFCLCIGVAVVLGAAS